MAGLKLPSIEKTVASEVKPSAGLVKSIMSKLKTKGPKIAKLKGIGSMPKVSNTMPTKFKRITATLSKTMSGK